MRQLAGQVTSSYGTPHCPNNCHLTWSLEETLESHLFDGAASGRPTTNPICQREKGMNVVIY